MARPTYTYPIAVQEEAEDLKALRSEIESFETTIAALVATKDQRQEHLYADLRNEVNKAHSLAHCQVIEEIEANIAELTNDRDKTQGILDVEIARIAEQSVEHGKCAAGNCKAFPIFDQSVAALREEAEGTRAAREVAVR